MFLPPGIPHNFCRNKMPPYRAAHADFRRNVRWLIKLKTVKLVKVKNDIGVHRELVRERERERASFPKERGNMATCP